MTPGPPQHDEGRAERLRRVLPQIVVVAWLPLCVGFAMVNREWLPPKYFFDGDQIEVEMGVATGPSTNSFITMAWIYRSVGLAHNATLVAAVTMLAFVALLLVCARWSDLPRLSLIEIGAFCFAAAAAAVYLAQYSKEGLILVLVGLLVLLPRHVAAELVFVAAACLYAAGVRPYWFMVVALYIALRVVLHVGRRPWMVPALLVLAMFGFAIAVAVLMGGDLDQFRSDVNQARANSDLAQTLIPTFVPGSGPLIGGLNGLVSLAILVVPVPLLLDPSPIYLGFAVVIACLWVLLVPVVRRGMVQGWFRRDVPLARAMALLIAMLTVQAVFEPDYGSYIKHLTPLLPLFLLVYARARAWRGASGTGPARSGNGVPRGVEAGHDGRFATHRGGP